MGCGQKKIIPTEALLSFAIFGVRLGILGGGSHPDAKSHTFISSAQNSCERTIITRDTAVSGPSGALLSTVWLRQPLENWKTLLGAFDVNTGGGFSSEPVQF